MKNKWMQLIKSRMLIKISGVYFLLLTIPLIILTIFIMSVQFNVLERNILKQNENQIELSFNNLQIHMNSFNSIASMAFSNPNFSSFTLQSSPLNAKELISSLEQYVAGNKMIADVALYSSDMGKVYTSSTVYDTDYFNQYVVLKDGSKITDVPDGYYKRRSTVADVRNFFNMIPGEYFVHVISTKSAVNSKAVAFFVRKEAMVSSILGSNSNTIVIDYDNGVLADTLDDPGILSVVGMVDITENYTKKVKLNNDNYFISSRFSKTFSLSVISINLYEDVLGDLLKVNRALIFSIIIIFAAGVIIILFGINITYKPIKQLYDTVFTHTSTTEEAKDEIQAVQKAFRRMHNDRMELDSRLRESDDTIKKYVIANMLRGDFASEGMMNIRLEEAEHVLKFPYYSVVIFHFSREVPNGQSVKEFLKGLKTQNAEQMEVFVTDIVYKDRIVIILSCGEEDINIVAGCVELIKASLDESMNIKTTAGVGNMYRDIHSFGRSYTEAETALNYRFFNAFERIIVFDKSMIAGDESQNYPTELLNELERAIFDGDYQKVFLLMDEFISNINLDVLPPFSARCLCFEIVSKIIRTMFTLGKQNAVDLIKLPDVTKFNSFDSKSNQLLFLDEVKSAFKRLDTGEKDNLNRCLYNNILEYVHNNYCHTDFKIKDVADKFYMSTSNLSHFFKQNNGNTISNYVTSLRIEEAKKLLRETLYPINEIVHRVGYSDISSFVRKFRNEVGMTPGSYRKEMNSEGESGDSSQKW